MFKAVIFFIVNFFKTTFEQKIPSDELYNVKVMTVRYQLLDLIPEIKFLVKRRLYYIFKYKWKRLIFYFIALSLIYFILSSMLNNDIEASSCVDYDNTTDIFIPLQNDSIMILENFLKQIAYIESRYNPSANRPGSQYWGLYQIGRNERNIAGFGHIPYNIYIKTPEIQHLTMINLLKHNKNFQKPYIEKYNNKIIDGILITESSILAMSHLVGVGETRRLLDSGKIPHQDKNKNPIRIFAKLGGYKLDLETYNMNKFDGRFN